MTFHSPFPMSLSTHFGADGSSVLCDHKFAMHLGSGNEAGGGIWILRGEDEEEVEGKGQGMIAGASQKPEEPSWREKPAPSSCQSPHPFTLAS
jgi:hypothetical protein